MRNFLLAIDLGNDVMSSFLVFFFFRGTSLVAGLPNKNPGSYIPMPKLSLLL